MLTSSRLVGVLELSRLSPQLTLMSEKLLNAKGNPEDQLGSKFGNRKAPREDIGAVNWLRWAASVIRQVASSRRVMWSDRSGGDVVPFIFINVTFSAMRCKCLDRFSAGLDKSGDWVMFICIRCELKSWLSDPLTIYRLNETSWLHRVEKACQDERHNWRHGQRV